MRTHLSHSSGLVGAAALVAALLTTGCGGAPGTAEAASAATEFSGVRFTLGSRGDIRVSGESRADVRPIGAFASTEQRAHPFTRPDGQLLVVLHHRPAPHTPDRASRGWATRPWPPEEPSVESGFLVDTADRVRADLDGHPLEQLRLGTIRIDVTGADTGDLVRLTLSASRGTTGSAGPDEPDAQACGGLDRRTSHRVVLPAVEAGTPVPDAAGELRKQCLDVQYASLPGGEPAGTVQRVLVPIAGQPITAAVVPPPDGTAPRGHAPGDTVSTDLSRPATIVVAR
ncbi:hypothetical protein [Streptomyces sp. NBC_01451]|uniref:hypothetical protein n=1 Tax=Streptomyces sp. NBC_01451 TaxID=2903872 RepID=UPI002E314CD5|nr:hypothetical protein [Streptomyces sp. NBC_01451]